MATADDEKAGMEPDLAVPVADFLMDLDSLRETFREVEQGYPDEGQPIELAAMDSWGNRLNEHARTLGLHRQAPEELEDRYPVYHRYDQDDLRLLAHGAQDCRDRDRLEAIRAEGGTIIGISGPSASGVPYPGHVEVAVGKDRLAFDEKAKDNAGKARGLLRFWALELVKAHTSLGLDYLVECRPLAAESLDENMPEIEKLLKLSQHNRVFMFAAAATAEAKELPPEDLLGWASRGQEYIELVTAATKSTTAPHVRQAVSRLQEEYKDAYLQLADGKPHDDGRELDKAIENLQTLWDAEADERDADAMEAPEGFVFCRSGNVWTLAFDGETVLLQDLVGLRYIAVLLAHRKANPKGEASLTAIQVFAAGRPASDIAEEFAPYQNISKEELGRVGLQNLSGALEKARVSMTKGINLVIDLLREAPPDGLPSLAKHLDNCIHLGKFPSYQPEDPIDWHL